jgi:hypothetical protein
VNNGLNDFCSTSVPIFATLKRGGKSKFGDTKLDRGMPGILRLTRDTQTEYKVAGIFFTSRRRIDKPPRYAHQATLRQLEFGVEEQASG